MPTFRIDAHAHLYDSYPLDVWCRTAVTALQAGDPKVVPSVVVVDREGQDSFARLARELSKDHWLEVCGGLAGIARVSQSSLLIIRGAQYVSRERIEVLGLGAIRGDFENFPASEIVTRISEQGGTPCLPWSPGKWFGSRGKVVRSILNACPVDRLTVGDIAIRSSFGPPSSLLRLARRRGYRVLFGSDSLPAPGEEALVGSLGIALRGVDDMSPTDVAAFILSWLREPGSNKGVMFGRRNGPLQALRRSLPRRFLLR